MKINILLFLLIVILNSTAFSSPNLIEMNSTQQNNNTEIATFAGGCFWCTEAIFEQVKGVQSVTSGYSGGTVINPSYREVTNGNTGHAEAIQIKYDPSVISFMELLEIFFKTHDPTTLNRQGADIGQQYRSAVFYHSEEQRKNASEIISALNEAKIWRDPIVTEVTGFINFFEAEDYHQEYFSANPDQGYCRLVIQPKLEKFKKVFNEKLK